MSNRIKPNPMVVCKNPKTNQILETTAKVFYSLYVDKGFELVTRENIEPDGRSEPAKSSGARGGEPRSIVGGAAAVAAALEIDNRTAGPETTPNSASRTQPNDEIETDTSGTVISDERQPAKRDRGRSS